MYLVTVTVIPRPQDGGALPRILSMLRSGWPSIGWRLRCLRMKVANKAMAIEHGGEGDVDQHRLWDVTGLRFVPVFPRLQPWE